MELQQDATFFQQGHYLSDDIFDQCADTDGRDEDKCELPDILLALHLGVKESKTKGDIIRYY